MRQKSAWTASVLEIADTVSKELYEKASTAAEEKDIEVAMLQQENEDAEAKCTSLMADLAAKAEGVTMAMEIAESAQNAGGKVASDLAAAQTSLAKVTADLGSKEEELSIAMNMAATLQSDDLAGVQGELAAAKAAAEKLRLENRDLQGQLATAMEFMEAGAYM